MIESCSVHPWDRGVWNTHPRMLPRVVKGDQKGHHGITYSVAVVVEYAYVILPTRGHMGRTLRAPH
jgi:hypothetical protein